jgi:hypothetical protein
VKNLPIVATPEYSVTLPISGKKIKIRPFLGKEEKILLMAMENHNSTESDIKEALKQIITNCIVTSNVDIEKLPNLDIEKIFIELRKRSVSETIDMKFNLRETFECDKSDCPEVCKVTIRLDSIEIKNLSTKKNVIMLDDKIGISLKYPTMESSDISATGSKTEALYEIIAGLIDEVFDGDDVTEASKFEKGTLVSWIENSFQHAQLEQVIDFITNQPYYYKEFEIKCALCGKTKPQEAKGLIDFFI